MKQTILILPKGQFTPLAELTAKGLISATINVVLIVASILFLFNFISGGIKFMLSAGNKEKSANAQRHLLNTTIGIIIIFSAWALLGFVGDFFGVDFTTFEIPVI